MEEGKILLKINEYTIQKEKIKDEQVILYIRDHKNEIDRKLLKLN